LSLFSSCELAPFDQRGGAVFLEIFAAAKMTFEVEAIVDGRLDSGEFLSAFCSPEFRHRPLASPQGLVRIFSSFVQPTPSLLPADVPEFAKR